jgi:hypothetical protein
MAVNVSATFKKDERDQNGLESIRPELIQSPLERHVIVATIEVTQILTDVRDGGVQTPSVRLVNVEPLTGDDALTARKLLDAAYHERTGQTAPPPTLFDPDDHLAEDAARVADEADSARGNPAFVEPGPDEAGLWPGDEGYVEPKPEQVTKRGRAK